MSMGYCSTRQKRYSKDMELKNTTVLVVDDDEMLREVIVYELSRHHLKTMEASNGTEAFQVVKNSKIDIVISDIKMPGGDGIELLKNIREMDPRIPVLIFMTGFSRILPKDAIALGARKVFEKPFDRKAFMDEIRTIASELKDSNP